MLGFARRVNEYWEDWEDWGVIVVEVGISIVVGAARKDGLGEGEGIAPYLGIEEWPNGRGLFRRPVNREETFMTKAGDAGLNACLLQSTCGEE